MISDQVWAAILADVRRRRFQLVIPYHEHANARLEPRPRRAPEPRYRRLAWLEANRRTLAAAAVTVALASCSSGGPLPPPAPSLLKSPPPLQDLTENDELVAKHAELRRNYSQCAGRLRSLQRYVRKAGE